MSHLRLLLSDANRLAASGFLLLALVLGGARQSTTSVHHWIQLVAIGVLAVTLFGASMRPLSREQWFWVVLALGAILWGLFQLVPLNAEFLGSLRDQEVVRSGASLLQTSEPNALGMSLAPEETLLSVLGFLPPLAIFVLIVRQGWTRSVERLVWAIPALATLSVAIGLAQLATTENSPLYFYEFTNRSSPVGFFANVNHQATLCLVSIPFLCVLARRVKQDFGSGDADMAKAIMVGVLWFSSILGILLAGSVAGYAIALPVLALSVPLVWSSRSKKEGLVGVASMAAIMLVSFGLVGITPIFDNIAVASFTGSGVDRMSIWTLSLDALRDHFVFGAGLGAYSSILPLYESVDAVSFRYINHVHNDYLEVFFELGLPGLFLMLIGLVAFVVRFGRIWLLDSSSEGRLKRAAGIAIMAILLHSLVDYPLRTPAIASLGAACLAILVTSRRSGRRLASTDAAENSKRISI